jgi:CubicO group peptidase (beta-lactamase class C family)
LRDWPETLAFSDVSWRGPINLEMILEMVRRQRELDFSLGEQEQYSNTGYNLLAASVSKVTGQSFREWTDEYLFRPLGMKHTHVCEDSSEVVPNLAESYALGDKGKFRRVVSQLSAQGSSSLFITAEDMSKWLLNFETARVGGKPAIELMRQSGRLNGGRKVNYGFGLSLDEYQGNPTISHGGSWAGYRSAAMAIPEKRFAVAVLSNTSNMDATGLADKIAEIYLGTSPVKSSTQSAAKAPAAVKSDPATWESFLGTYRLGPGWLLTITREGDKLMAQASRENKFKMTPTGTNTFFVEAYGRLVEFVRQPADSVTNLLYRGINAPKLKLPEPTSAYLATYLGDYWSEELRVVARLEIHDGKLATQARSGDWIHFAPTETDWFDAEGAGLVLEFTRNAASEVTEAKLSAGRVRHIRYSRVTLPKAGAAAGGTAKP